MNMSFLHGTVIAVAFLQASTAAPQALDPTTDRDTYALYATMLQLRARNRPTAGPIVVQGETERPTACSEFLADMTGEWAEVAASFQRENGRVRLLQPGVLMGVEYRLVARAEILADDARLAAAKPGLSNSVTAGAIEYVALSAVGFNAAKTKALIYVRDRTAGGLSYGIGMMELKEGRWIAGSRSCGGVA
jgi:hypothetical protein